MSEKLPVTVVVPVKNEEANLERCLRRLDRFAAVVVVDSNSTDRTRAIAAEHGASLINFDWDGKYPKKRNWFLLNHPPETAWVLFLDADELVDDAFADAVASATADPRYNGYWLCYTNHFIGRPLRHGVAQRKLALFRVGKALFERIDESDWSRLDMEVHEHPIVEGEVGLISTRIDHRDDRGVAKFIDRHRDYALWEAERTLALRQGAALGPGEMTRRQTMKYANIDRWWYAWAYFAYDFIGQRGFLDGAAGFHYAFYKLWYFKTIRLLIRERLAARGLSRSS